MSTDRQRGLYGKFLVERADGSSAPGGKHAGCEYFVLDVTHDRHAKAALAAYADSAEVAYPLLAADLRARWLPPDAGQASAAACTCPSGDGSLRWPCPVHAMALVAPDGWPKLTAPARVGNGTFGTGISTHRVVEAAMRAFQFAGDCRDLTTEQAREAERNRRAIWDKLNGPLSGKPR